MDWATGYVADIGYTAGFYRENGPNHLAFSALSIGRSPGRSMRPKRVLEIGFGQGFGLSLLAAANPDVEFEGYDFNPEHVANAQRLIQGAGLSNLAISETSFEEAAAQGGDNNLDVITMHGILTWVSREAQNAIVAIARQRLQPDGVVYASYNCMPGWAPLMPIRQFMMQVKRRNAGRSDRQLALALDMVTKLKEGNAAYFAANPSAIAQVDGMPKQDRNYLIHEYLDENWFIFEFSDIVSLLGQAKLQYVSSATLTENLDQYAVPRTLLPLLQQTDDPILRETVRDMAGNRRFRRDIFARGTAIVTPPEHRQLLSEISFALVPPRQSVSFKFAGPLGELSGIAELYGPLVDLMAEKPVSFNDLIALPSFGEAKVGQLLDCLCLLVQSGQVIPFVATPTIDHGPAQRFNRMIVENARAGRLYYALASPVARTGIPIGDFGLLTLSALYDGKGDNEVEAAKHALALLVGIGRRPLKEGKLLQDDAEALAFLELNLKPVLDNQVPIWKRLGML
jgi:predicted O-methyltransferase YrrM